MNDDKNELDKLAAKIYDLDYGTGATKEVKEFERNYVDLPIKLESVVPGFEEDHLYNENNIFEKNYLGFGNRETENVSLKKKSVIEMPEVKKKWYEDINTSSVSYMSPLGALRDYTGTTYGHFNKSILSLVGGSKPDDAVDEYVKNLIDYFIEDAPTLDRGIWVYRNGRVGNQELIEAGKFFTNAPFMSVSVRATMAMGSDKMRHMIYLPAGTRCFPIFDKSQNIGEDEIVLAPMSTFKIVDVYHFPDQTRKYALKSVYVGSSVESLKEMIEKNETFDIGQSAVFEAEKYIENTRRMLNEAMNQKDIEKNDGPDKSKWGDLTSMNFSEKVQKAIKDKKLKLSMDFGKKTKKKT